MNTPAAFKQVDVTRAVKGVVAAGLPVERVEIDNLSGNIVVVTDRGTSDEVNDWDET